MYPIKNRGLTQVHRVPAPLAEPVVLIKLQTRFIKKTN
jgi:hypothetical protein